MKKFSIKFISIILTIAILLVSLPLTVLAAVNEDSSQYGDEVSTSTLGNADLYTYELTHRRDEYTKHFRNADGTVTAIQYSVPLHRLNEDGLWEEIDNTIALSGNEYTTADARIKFAKKTTGNETLLQICMLIQLIRAQITVLCPILMPIRRPEYTGRHLLFLIFQITHI